VKVLTLINNSGGSGGGSGSSSGDGHLLVTTSVSGNQAFYIPGNVKVISIVGTSSAAKEAVSMSLVGNADPFLFFGPVDWLAGEKKTFAPMVYVPALSQIVTANTNVAGPNLFKFYITYIILPASF